MDVLRVGDKLVSREKISRMVDRILEARATGKSQQEVANQLGIDRTFISRLENLGEVRKGQRMALIGFPVKNTEELLEIARQEGVDFTLLFNDDERWDFLESKSGVQLFNEVMGIISAIKEFDTVFFLGSDMRIDLVEAVLGHDSVIGISLGQSPVKGNVYVDPELIRELVRSVRGN